MSHYCGIDLHSNNHVVVVIDERDKRVFDKRLNNDLSATLNVLAPYRETLKGIAVESTFNWYWLVDGLQDNGFGVQLVNTAAVKQYDGLKYSGDHQEAFHLAHLMRLGILPTGYIYPKETKSDKRSVATKNVTGQVCKYATYQCTKSDLAFKQVFG